MSRSLGRMPKLASQQKMNSIPLFANQSTSLRIRSSANEFTLLATAEPLSQKVHEKGHPRFVSQSAIQRSDELASISGANTPSKYGDGNSDRSFARPTLGFLTISPAEFRKLTDGTISQFRPSRFSRIVTATCSPSPWQARSIKGYLFKKSGSRSGTCGPPNTMTVSGFVRFNLSAICSEI